MVQLTTAQIVTGAISLVGAIVALWRLLQQQYLTRIKEAQMHAEVHRVRAEQAEKDLRILRQDYAQSAHQWLMHLRKSSRPPGPPGG